MMVGSRQAVGTGAGVKVGSRNRGGCECRQ